MTSKTGSDSPPEWEIVCEPGVRASWALRINEIPADVSEVNATDDATERSYAPTLLDIEKSIADLIQERGDSVARIVHTFGGRDVHLRDGSRVEIRWEMIVSDWRCLDCGVDTDAISEYYMVLDPIWEQAAPGLDGHLCIECLEHRLGRTLLASDFSAREINTNTAMPRSRRLAARLRNESDTHSSAS